jgi:hypothetical protein
MPGSHCVAVCISDFGYAGYFDSYGLPPYKFEIIVFLKRHSIFWTSSATDYMDSLRMTAFTIAASTPSTEAGKNDDIIREHACT